MRARLTKLMAGLTVIGALAFGGAAVAGAADTTPAPPAAVDVQQGDQTAPDVGGTSESSSESGSSSESASIESSSESASSESASASDGPGGHADEPGNASADYQFEGEQ